MSAHEHLSEEQFTPKITGSRRQYGTSTVETEPHEVPDAGRRLLVDHYNWHDGDSKPTYIEARGPVLKKDGTPGKQHGYTLTGARTPPHVLEEMKKLRGE